MDTRGDNQELTPPLNDNTSAGTPISPTTLLVLALLAGVATVGSAVRAVTSGSMALSAFSLQAVLLLHGSLLVRHAVRLRAGLARIVERAKEPRPSEPVHRVTNWGDPTEVTGDAFDWQLAHFAHLRSLHYVFVGIAPTAVIGLLAIFQLYRPVGRSAAATSAAEASAVALLCLVAVCLWLVFNRMFSEASDKQPDRDFLKDITRESLVTGVIVAVAVVGSLMWLPVDLLTGKALCMWILAVCLELSLRLALLQRHAIEFDDNFVPTPRVMFREAVFRHGNPLRSMSMALETRLGVSLRSSWAIRFAVSAIFPAAVVVGLMQWGLSSLAVVPIDHLGNRETSGRTAGTALQPGLHWKLPWPFGRLQVYPAKPVTTKYIGFVEDPNNQPEFLWSKKHAQQEFALVLGGGVELIAVDCMVYYKIGETDKELLKYAYEFQNPEMAVEAYAYRALMERTQAATLEEILSTNRLEFADGIEDRLRGYCRENDLGIEVVEVALIGLHPPVEVAADYLDVVSARIDAERMQTEANGEALVKIEEARRESGTAVAEAKSKAARRVGDALEESSEFLAIGSAYLVSPEAYSIRLWFETLEETLQSKPFVLVDASLQTEGGGILLDQRGKIETGDPVTISHPAIP